MLLLATLLGCPAIDLADLEARLDADGDGFEAETLGGTDCDDADAAVNPDAEEVWYDGVDQDCDGADDDRDGDGFGIATDCDDALAAVHPGADEACDGIDDDCSSAGSAPDDELDVDGDGWRVCDGDCDDGDAEVSPGAAEVCDGAGTDEDCDRDVDDGDDDVQGRLTWYADADGDGFGDADAAVEACAEPWGYVDDASDCDDGDTARFPGATWFRDADGDGYGEDGDVTEACAPDDGWVADAGDCDDADPATHPAAGEICDGDDDDCDGLVDDDDDDVSVDQAVWYRDADGDGWGNDYLRLRTCASLVGYTHVPGDCDDADGVANPGAVEVCDGIDDDCDGLVDDDDLDVAAAPAWYADADGDGWGDPAVAFVACVAPAGYGAGAGDCDEADPTVNDGAGETCDGRDEDCDGLVDDDDPDVTGAPTWFADADGDGWGGEATTTACTLPAGASGAGGDCDDADPAVSPGASESCATASDDDCDGDTNDEGADGCEVRYADEDADGFGAGDPACLCVATGAFSVEVDGDCDDGDAAVSPAAVETCLTAADDDCDGTPDAEGAEGCVDRYLDADHDGFGTGDAACHCAGESDYRALRGEDCDDADPDVWPTAPITCLDDVDDDCDGAHDTCTVAEADLTLEGGAESDYVGSAVAWVDDVDGDGWPDALVGGWGLDTAGTSSGAAWLVSGAATGSGYGGDFALATLSGGDDQWLLGEYVGPAGDVDGDGVGDVFVGSYYADGGAEQGGGVYVFSGASRGDVDASAAFFAIEGTTASQFFSSTATAVPDTNGDGILDLAVGSVLDDDFGSYTGAAYVALGPLSGFTASSDHVRITGTGAGDRAGADVVAADLDADGRSDLVITGLQNGDCAAWVFLADAVVDGTVGDADVDVVIPTTSSSSPCQAAGIGDADADGVDDVGVSSAYDGAGGSVWILTSVPAAEASVSDVATVVYTSSSTSTRLGSSLGGADDIDGDGRADLLAGDPYGGTSDAGVVWVVPTPDPGSYTIDDVALDEIYGDAEDGLGGGSAGGADGDGDGAVDILVGAAGHDTTYDDVGAAWIVRGGLP